MKIYKSIADIQNFIGSQKLKNNSVGFVPTMGALHVGHTALIRESKQLCKVTVVSIFVNPTQFNDKKDLEKYPRTIDSDIKALHAAGCDLSFLPSVEEIYPAGETAKVYELGDLEQVFEGASRPGHFQGVCQVVDKLFQIVKPTDVFFGQKDYQQCLVIKKLLGLTPSFHNMNMHIIPTMRETSGLAMSSRNMRLSITDREKAATIYQTLIFIRQHITAGNQLNLIGRAIEMLSNKGFKVDYVALADANNLQPLEDWDGQQKLVVLIAAFLGGVRLIDNMVL